MLTKIASTAIAALSLGSVVQARPGKSLAERSNIINNVWCGPVLAKAATSVSAVWTVPKATVPSSGGSKDLMAYQWVGIDGVGGSHCGSALLQGGTAQVYNSNGGFTYDFWFEFYSPDNTSSWHIQDPVVKAGDQVRVTASVDNDYHGTIFFENLSRGTTHTEYAWSANTPLCYEHVEWIQEAPVSLLPNFKDFSFTQMTASDANGNTFNAAGSDLWYLDSKGAKCSASLTDNGDTAIITNKVALH